MPWSTSFLASEQLYATSVNYRLNSIILMLYKTLKTIWYQAWHYETHQSILILECQKGSNTSELHFIYVLILLVGDSRWYKQVVELNIPYAIAADYVLVDIFCMREYYPFKFIMLLFTCTVLIGMWHFKNLFPGNIHKQFSSIQANAFSEPDI